MTVSTQQVQQFSTGFLRASLAIIIFWVGAMKFTSYEAHAIKGLVESSPFMSWLYGVGSVEGISSFIGATELIIATLIVIGFKVPKIGVVGAAAAAGMFLTTLSFIFTAPGWEASLGGFPALSVVPGQFIIKDLALLAVAVFLAVSDFAKVTE